MSCVCVCAVRFGVCGTYMYGMMCLMCVVCVVCVVYGACMWYMSVVHVCDVMCLICVVCKYVYILVYVYTTYKCMCVCQVCMWCTYTCRLAYNRVWCVMCGVVCVWGGCGLCVWYGVVYDGM